MPHADQIGEGPASGGRVRAINIWRRFRHVGLAILLVFLVLKVDARINVVTLPGRDSVQLTIYNSVDLTLVKETRHLTFRNGLNRLEFSWANTLIDPTSVEIRAVTQADAVDVLDVSFPPRVTNTLEWRINSSFSGEVVVEIRYFTSGIRWAADYVAEASSTEKMMDLAGQVRVTNNSGEDYENSQIRLVVGVIRLVEDIAQLAQQKHPESFGMTRKLAELGDVDKNGLYSEFKTGLGVAEGLSREGDRKKQVVKEGLSEYFLYTVEGQDTIPNGWSKRLPSFRAAEVPITSFYKYEREQWNDRVMRYYRFTNSTPSKLGNEPLPDGNVKAFRFINDEKLYAFVGSTAVKYIPVNEQVDLELGSDLEVRVKPALMNWEKVDLQFDNQGNVKGWTTRETWEIELQNSKEIGVVVDVRRNFAGDWSIETKTNYEKVDANKIKFVVPLQAKQKQTVTYIVTTRHGTNARK